MEKVMREAIIFWLSIILWCGNGAGCTPVWHTPILQGLPLTPGRYLTAYYQSPDFKPVPASYRLKDFSFEQVTGVDKSLAERFFREELLTALENNGLPLKAQEADYTLAGQVSQLHLRGPVLRYLSGKSQATLKVAGVISRGPEVVYAFQDQVQVTWPINPRHPTSMESELMVRQVMRRFASDLLNEMLLPPPAPATAATSSPAPRDQGFMAEGG